MDVPGKVGVKLTAVKGGGQRQVPQQRLPARLSNVRDKSRLRLVQLLAQMFDYADDALFEMADRAGSNHEQNIYFESMRTLRIDRRRIEMAFAQALDAAFAEIRSGSEQPAGQAAPARKLSLVADEEIESVLAAEGMVARTMTQAADELSLLSMRFESLLNGISLNNDNNPLSPKAVSQAFVRASSGLQVDVKAHLFLLKLFEKYVLRELVDIYRGLNRELAEDGVLKNISLADKVQQAGRGGADSPAEDRLLEGGAAKSDLAGDGQDDVFSQLQRLLQAGAPAGMSRREVAGDGAVKIVRRALVLDMLSNLQARMPAMDADASGYLRDLPGDSDIGQALLELLNQSEEDGRYELGRVDEDAINLVSMLFQFVLDDDNIAPPIKALLSRLQFPMAKVALMDKRFFGEGGHPARKLLNAMAQAGIGWEPAASAERDFLYRKIKQTVETVLARFEDDIGVFQEALTDFASFVDNERRRAGIVEQRTLEAEQGKARAELARRSVASTIARCTEHKSIPGVIAELLEHAWSKAMFLIYVREGDSSEAWKSSVRILEELVWSVQPKHGESERQRLAKLMPALAKDIRDGLSRVGFSHFALNHFFEQLSGIHQCLLERAPALDDAPPLAHQAPPPGTGVDGESLRSTLDNMLSGNRFGGDGEPSAAADDASAEWPRETPAADAAPQQPPLALDEATLALVDRLTMGSWVQYNQHAEASFRCRLAAIMKPTGNYIFVNRSGKKVAEWSREQLAAKVAANIVNLLDDRLLFDRALESVISQLKQNRQ